MKLKEAIDNYDFDYSSKTNQMPLRPKYAPMETVFFNWKGERARASIESGFSNGQGVQYNLVVMMPNNVQKRSFVIDELDLSESSGKIWMKKQVDLDNLEVDQEKVINPIAPK